MDVSLCKGCRERDARIAELEAQVARLLAEVAALKLQLSAFQDRIDDLSKKQKPRADAKPEQPAAPDRKPTGRKPGAQPGHPPHLKRLLPRERVKETLQYVPKACAHCAAPLPNEPQPTDPEPKRHQVIEVPEAAAYAIEHQALGRTCPCCGKVTWGEIPEPVRAHGVGPRLASLLSYFVGAHHVSRRGAEQIAQEVFGAPIALGTVSNLEQETSAALAPAHAEAVQAVQAADTKNVDETGWKKVGAKRWLWVAATSFVAAFLIHPLRNHVPMTRLLGTMIYGTVCSDRWRTYQRLPRRRWQICWAHLKRNFAKLAEGGGKAKAIGQRCLNVLERVFELWHLFRGGGCSRLPMRRRMAPLRKELRTVLQEGGRSRHRKVARFCQRLLKVFPALWTSLRVEGVEPTNNHGERVLRLAVIWRKCCYGCHSDDGCRFVERLVTAVQTLRLQKRPVLDFLYQTILAHRTGQMLPKLVPTG
jgi:transposase